LDDRTVRELARAQARQTAFYRVGFWILAASLAYVVWFGTG